MRFYTLMEYLRNDNPNVKPYSTTLIFEFLNWHWLGCSHCVRHIQQQRWVLTSSAETWLANKSVSGQCEMKGRRNRNTLTQLQETCQNEMRKVLLVLFFYYKWWWKVNYVNGEKTDDCKMWCLIVTGSEWTSYLKYFINSQSLIWLIATPYCSIYTVFLYWVSFFYCCCLCTHTHDPTRGAGTLLLCHIYFVMIIGLNSSHMGSVVEIN